MPVRCESVALRAAPAPEGVATVLRPGADQLVEEGPARVGLAGGEGAIGFGVGRHHVGDGVVDGLDDRVAVVDERAAPGPDVGPGLPHGARRAGDGLDEPFEGDLARRGVIGGDAQAARDRRAGA